MADLAIPDQRIHRGTHDLRGNGKACARERTRAGDQESVDPDHFASRIDQRATGIPEIDGRVGLNEFTRLPPVSCGRIRTVKRADDSASHGETQSKWIAEREHRLSGVQFR